MVPGRALDGNTAADPSVGSCFHSDGGYWWMVDLGEHYMVNSVTIFNRDVRPDSKWVQTL